MNTKKDGIIFLYALIYSTSVVFSIILFKNIRAYKKNFAKKVFIVAFPKDDFDSETVAAKINKLENVRRVEIINREKILTALGGDLKDKIFLKRVPQIELPDAIRIYPEKAKYTIVQQIAEKILDMEEIKSVRTGGDNLKKIFLFFNSLKKIEIYIYIFLIFLFASTFLIITEEMKGLNLKIEFLRQRNYKTSAIFLKAATTILIYPIAATVGAIFILLILRETISLNIRFLQVWDIGLLYIISNLPFLFAFFKK
jgi:hypothetical protein